jgi:uncharacterized membrane protein
MKLNWGVWLYGLVAAVLGGGSTAVVSGFGNMVYDPATYNIHAGLKHLLAMVLVTFIVSAVINFFIYLAKHPLPAWDGVTDRRGNGTNGGVTPGGGK